MGVQIGGATWRRSSCRWGWRRTWRRCGRWRREGIQRGHMTLHARQVAIAAGAPVTQIDRLADQMVAEGAVRIDRAEEILKEIRGT